MHNWGSDDFWAYIYRISHEVLQIPPNARRSLSFSVSSTQTEHKVWGRSINISSFQKFGKASKHTYAMQMFKLPAIIWESSSDEHRAGGGDGCVPLLPALSPTPWPWASWLTSPQFADLGGQIFCKALKWVDSHIRTTLRLPKPSATAQSNEKCHCKCPQDAGNRKSPRGGDLLEPTAQLTRSTLFFLYFFKRWQGDNRSFVLTHLRGVQRQGHVESQLGSASDPSIRALRGPQGHTALSPSRAALSAPPRPSDTHRAVQRYVAFHPQVQLLRSNVRTAPIHWGKRSSLRETRERRRSNWTLKAHLLKAEKQERRHTLHLSPLLFSSGDQGGGSGALTARPRSARPGTERCPRRAAPHSPRPGRPTARAEAWQRGLTGAGGAPCGPGPKGRPGLEGPLGAGQRKAGRAGGDVPLPPQRRRAAPPAPHSPLGAAGCGLARRPLCAAPPPPAPVTAGSVVAMAAGMAADSLLPPAIARRQQVTPPAPRSRLPPPCQAVCQSARQHEAVVVDRSAGLFGVFFLSPDGQCPQAVVQQNTWSDALILWAVLLLRLFCVPLMYLMASFLLSCLWTSAPFTQRSSHHLCFYSALGFLALYGAKNTAPQSLCDHFQL